MKKFNKYQFRNYQQDFPKLFSKEKSKLKKFLPKNSKIEHIGSTSVKNLGGKGVIDIILGVDKKDLINVKNKLINSKYNFIKSAGDKERIFFEKDYTYKDKIRRVHIQLTYFDGKIWKNAILFRDYLKYNKKPCELYEKTKKMGVKLCKGNGKKYRNYKDKIIKQLLKEAKK